MTIKNFQNQKCITIDRNAIHNETETVYVKGLTCDSYVANSSRGFDLNNNEIYFIPTSRRLKEDLYLIPDKAIFMVNGVVSNGLVCERFQCDQVSHNITFRRQDWFRVVQSSVENILAGSIVVVEANTAHKFLRLVNGEYREQCYVNCNNLILKIGKDGSIKTGEKFLLLDSPSFECGCKKCIRMYNFCMFGDKKLYYTSIYGEIVISGTKKTLVRADDIYGEDQVDA